MRTPVETRVRNPLAEDDPLPPYKQAEIAVEEVLLTESNCNGNRFRYMVWNYTNPKFRDVSCAAGEFVRTWRMPQ
jgi:hypothetical protein